ncbi:MAG: L-threonylcarbamoyladenylate synthase [Planctomycetia bacterium]|nr:L-threonylcarbamoyladenylate synthase [Planctomycetia bacterium]
MALSVIKLKEIEQTDEVVQQTIDALRAGKLVVFPTETVYGLGALASQPQAVERLISSKGRKTGHALPIAISGLDVLTEYVPALDSLSERLARRCWPGPITLVLDGTSESSRLRELSTFVQKAIMPNKTVGIRVPKHSVFLDILKQLNEPIVLTSANLTGEKPATSAEMVADSLGDLADLMLDDGTAQYKTPSTVVEMINNKVNILREGAISKENIKRLTAKIILFVCTGNTCRSPMAELLCSHILAEHLHCSLDELEDNGYLVMSAGVATTAAIQASQGAKEAMKSFGLSLDEHESQPLCDFLIQFADLIYVMGRAHRSAILSKWPEVDSRLFILRPDNVDVSDPLGCDVDVYMQCADQIKKAIEQRINDIL